MADFLFHFFATLTLLAGGAMIFSRNLVNGAMYMILALSGVAGLFVMLEAYLLAILQVLIYAGAVVVLFLFIIMLLNVDEMSRKRPRIPTMAAGLVGAALLVAGGLSLTGAPGSEGVLVPDFTPPASVARNFGEILFTRYMLPFQVAGLLLLAAMVGVIVLSKRSPGESIPLTAALPGADSDKDGSSPLQQSRKPAESVEAP